MMPQEDRFCPSKFFILEVEREAVRVVTIECSGDAQAVGDEVITKVEPRLRGGSVALSGGGGMSGTVR